MQWKHPGMEWKHPGMEWNHQVWNLTGMHGVEAACTYAWSGMDHAGTTRYGMEPLKIATLTDFCGHFVQFLLWSAHEYHIQTSLGELKNHKAKISLTKHLRIAELQLLDPGTRQFPLYTRHFPLYMHAHLPWNKTAPRAPISFQPKGVSPVYLRFHS